MAEQDPKKQPPQDQTIVDQEQNLNMANEALENYKQGIEKNPTLAIQKFNETLQINSQYIAAYYYRDQSYYQTRQYSLARRDFTYVANYSHKKDFTDGARRMLEKLKGIQ